MIAVDGYRIKTWLHVLVLSLPMFVSSCAYLPELTSQAPDNWLTTVESRQQVKAWKIKARLGVQTNNNGGSMDLFWDQNDDRYTIRMIAPMGQGTILIKGDARGVYIKTKEGESFSESAEDLMEQSLGVKVPISGLRNWLRGLPMADKTIQKQGWDKQGRLHALVQDDWNIEMSNYREVGKYQLPHRFYLSRDDRPELDIRLLIKQWKLTDESSQI